MGGWIVPLSALLVFLDSEGASGQVEAQDPVPTGIEATVITTQPDAVPASSGVDGASRSYFLGVHAGLLKVQSERKREVDKSGALLGFELGRRWQFSDAWVGAGVGFIHGSVKGSSPLTRGDQMARLGSALLHLNLGYRVSPIFGAVIGLQSWLNRGANFSPESYAESGKLFGYFEIKAHLPSMDPVDINLRYTQDLNIEERDVASFTLGITYQLPL